MTTIDDLNQQYGFSRSCAKPASQIFEIAEAATVAHLTPGRFNGRPPVHGIEDMGSSRYYRIQSKGLGGQIVLGLALEVAEAADVNTVTFSVSSAILNGGKLIGDTHRRLERFSSDISSKLS